MNPFRRIAEVPAFGDPIVSPEELNRILVDWLKRKF
jgi:hypothetical protein